MRSGAVVLLVSAVALVALSTAVGASSPRSLPRTALYPNTVAFRDSRYGIVGTGLTYCPYGTGHCRLRGTISQTTDGGKTWHLVRRTGSPVVYAAWFHDVFYVQLLNGREYRGGGRNWERNPGHLFGAYCPKGWYSRGVTADIVDTNEVQPWSLCLGQGGAGNEAKAVYRGTTRVAYTPMTGGHARGQIGSYGYPEGIAGGYGGFGMLWESRGTLYITHDGGHHWYSKPNVAQPEIDFGQWADVVWGKLGFVLLERRQRSRLLETTDAGRTWRVVHRWR